MPAREGSSGFGSQAGTEAVEKCVVSVQWLIDAP